MGNGYETKLESIDGHRKKERPKDKEGKETKDWERPKVWWYKKTKDWERPDWTKTIHKKKTRKQGKTGEEPYLVTLRKIKSKRCNQENPEGIKRLINWFVNELK